MRLKQVGNKADLAAVVVRNSEASASIPVGSPVKLALTGTNDGLDVLLLGTTDASLAHGAMYGVALSTMASGDYGEAQVFGFCNNIVLLAQTRAATSDSWSSSSAAKGVILVGDTVNNIFSTSGGTQAKTGFLPFAILGASYSAAASASATSDTRTVITASAKAFLRMM